MPAAHTAGSIAKINHAFSPTPLGHDLFAEFGDERSLPIVGNFDPPLSPQSVAALGKSMGDFDGSGKVDQADYNVWRSSFGSTTNLAADANGNGVVDSADYSMWRDHMGQSVPGAGGGSAASTQVALMQVVSPAVSDSAPVSSEQAADSSASAQYFASTTNAVAKTTDVLTATVPANANQLDRALLLLLDEPSLTASVQPVETSIAANTEDSAQSEDAAAADGDALAVAWQSWGAL